MIVSPETHPNNGAEDFARVPFQIIEPMLDSIDPLIVDYAVE
jgi:hypothetical protein